MKRKSLIYYSDNFSTLSENELQELQEIHPFYFEVLKYKNNFYNSIDKHISNPQLKANLKDCLLDHINQSHPELQCLLRTSKYPHLKVFTVSLTQSHKDFLENALSGLCNVEHISEKLIPFPFSGLSLQSKLFGWLKQLKNVFSLSHPNKWIQQIKRLVFGKKASKAQREEFLKVFEEVFAKEQKSFSIFEKAQVERYLQLCVDFEQRLFPYLMQKDFKAIVVLGNETTSESRLLASLCKKNKIPVIHFPHGATVSELPLPKVVDYFIAETKREADFVKDYWNYKDEEIIKAGSFAKGNFPSFEERKQEKEIARQKFFNAFNLIDIGQTIITYGGTWIGYRSIGCNYTLDEFKKFIESLSKLIQNQPEKKFIFVHKPHPSYRSNFHYPLELFAGIINLPNCLYIEANTFDNILLASNLYLSNESTTNQEALWASCPIASLSPISLAEAIPPVLGEFANYKNVACIAGFGDYLDSSLWDFISSSLGSKAYTQAIHEEFCYAWKGLFYGNKFQTKLRVRQLIEELASKES